MYYQLKKFIIANIDLIDENSKESWEQVYTKLSYRVKGEFTQAILNAGINDPAEILEDIPGYYLSNSSIENYNIPSNVTSIGDYAFEKCDSLTSIVIGDSVTKIENHAFFTCVNLMSAIIMGNVQHIGAFAFAGCDHLTYMVISGSVTSVGDYAFYNCWNLKEIRFDGTKREAISCGIGNQNRKKWRENSAIEKIICIDGEIVLE